MPCIWGQHSGAQLFCAAVVIPSDAPGILQTPDGGSYQGEIHAVRALIDTGATITCVSSRLAKILKLQPVGKVPVHGVAGIVPHNSYLFLIAFPFNVLPGQKPPADLSVGPGQMATQIHLLQKVLQGFEFEGGATPAFDVLLGMDVISTGSLVVQGNGTFSFSF